MTEVKRTRKVGRKRMKVLKGCVNVRVGVGVQVRYEMKT